MAKWREYLGLPEPEPDGRSRNRWYKFYRHMTESCYDKDGKYFLKYTVYEEWIKNFWTFVEFADNLKKQEYQKGKKISRIDHSHGFHPDNIGFHTQKEITWKRANTHKIEINGVIKHVSEVHEILKTQGIHMNEQVVRDRAARGEFVGELNKVYGTRLWNGVYKSLKQICKDENSNYGRAKLWLQKGKSLEESIELAKTNNNANVFYEYNGLTYNQNQLSILLAKELNTLPHTIQQRLRKGMTIQQAKDKPLRKSRKKY